MSDFAKRGLGRGLSALLGEPVRTETPTPANAPAWPAPAADAQRAPIEPPRNVFELPITSQPAAAPLEPEPESEPATLQPEAPATRLAD